LHEYDGASIVDKFTLWMVIIFALTLLTLFLIACYRMEPMAGMLFNAIDKQAKFAGEMAQQREQFKRMNIEQHPTNQFAETKGTEAE